MTKTKAKCWHVWYAPDAADGRFWNVGAVNEETTRYRRIVVRAPCETFRDDGNGKGYLLVRGHARVSGDVVTFVPEFLTPADIFYDPQGTVEAGHCNVCDLSWHKFPDGPAECPRCKPDQPTPLAQRLHDETDYLGPDWVWSPARGPWGSWVPLKDFVLVPKDETDAAYSALTPYAAEFNPSMSIFPVLVTRYVDLRRKVDTIAGFLRKVVADIDEMLPRDWTEEPRAKERVQAFADSIVKVGDVVEISPASPRYACCFARVDAVYGWGVQASVPIDFDREIPIRLERHQFAKIGRAVDRSTVKATI